MDDSREATAMMDDSSSADSHDEDHSNGTDIEEALRDTIKQAEDENDADDDNPNDHVFDSPPSDLYVVSQY